MIEYNMCHLFFIHIINILLIDQIVTITPNTIYTIKAYLLKIIMGNQCPHIITRLDFDRLSDMFRYLRNGTFSKLSMVH